MLFNFYSHHISIPRSNTQLFTFLQATYTAAESVACWNGSRFQKDIMGTDFQGQSTRSEEGINGKEIIRYDSYGHNPKACISLIHISLQYIGHLSDYWSVIWIQCWVYLHLILHNLLPHVHVKWHPPITTNKRLGICFIVVCFKLYVLSNLFPIFFPQIAWILDLSHDHRLMDQLISPDIQLQFISLI